MVNLYRIVSLRYSFFIDWIGAFGFEISRSLLRYAYLALTEPKLPARLRDVEPQTDTGP